MLPTRQANLTSIRRDAWVEVDLNAIEQNLRFVRNRLKPPIKGIGPNNPDQAPRLMAVVKSDGYGHGASSVAEVLEASSEGVDWLGVASIDEGTQLRASGIKLPILILSPTPSWAISTALENKLDITLSSEKQIRDVAACGRARVHLKIDTGMHRLGVPFEKLEETLKLIKSLDNLELVSVYSHLAKAANEEAVSSQNNLFNQAIALTKHYFSNVFFHLASSEATIFPHVHYDLVRVGLYLYGLQPDTVSPDLPLRPALSVRARINHINKIAAGQSVGYSWTWTAENETLLASIPIGYADGVDRGLSNRMQGLLMGKTVTQVGRISMDQMLFDISNVPEAQEGDVITLIGSDSDIERNADNGQTKLTLSQWAETLGTITYELACRLRTRLPRVYTRTKQK
ncbi:MAG: alanine racemase [Candidatus Melainabacteria bacterium]|nr:alanine racemase [Candidatus Melainabacteria bacterium]